MFCERLTVSKLLGTTVPRGYIYCWVLELASASFSCHTVSVSHSTIVLIKVTNGSHKNFSQNYNSFQILSSRKLEADLRSNGLKESNKKPCICLEPFPHAGLTFPHPQELRGWQTPKTADHREAPWASKERRKIRKENRQHLP